MDGHKIVIVKDPRCKNNLLQVTHPILSFNPKHITQFITSIYHLATSSHIMLDNYYGFLAAVDFKQGVKCVQLWHAAGAIKKFGLEDLTNRTRSKRAINRFKAVYKRFDHVVVGSDEMVEIFMRSFGLQKDRFLCTGIPRTDFFYDKLQMGHAVHVLREQFPMIQSKKVLLYAPTYRDGALRSTEIPLDLDKMYQQLKLEYVLLLRLHPAVSRKFENKYPDFMYNVSGYPNMNPLLVRADILITDYSSIPFEFSLLNKPMIFYAYDYKEYGLKRGLWEDYAAQVPGMVVMSTDELIDTIQKQNFRMERVQAFARKWNQYSNGQASQNLIQILYKG